MTIFAFVALTALGQAGPGQPPGAVGLENPNLATDTAAGWMGTTASADAGETQALRSFFGQGVVRRIAADRRHVTIHHREIPGFMPEMTMEFSVRLTNELDRIAPGAGVTFHLLVGKEEAWIEDLQLGGRAAEPVLGPPGAPASPVSELKAGDPWPDGTVLTEEGRRMRFSDFRGRTVALSFFFTRCPLPDYCPRMNRNFAKTLDLLQAGAGPRTDCVFLSVSFDPEFDTPGQLAAYARSYRECPPAAWVFAAAPPETLARLPRRLGLSVTREGGGISHNLRTVVLDPRGRVFRQFTGNTWTPEELAQAMQLAAQSPTTEKRP